ncbi:hypothetical protein BSLA_02f2621 [Burkholderia stabilis]|nr:hypothetical protein BSLA_02f2621 [Burkholderia stabilis]
MGVHRVLSPCSGPACRGPSNRYGSVSSRRRRAPAGQWKAVLHATQRQPRDPWKPDWISTKAFLLASCTPSLQPSPESFTPPNGVGWPTSSRAPRAIASFTCCSRHFATASSITVLHVERAHAFTHSRIHAFTHSHVHARW